MKIEVRFRGIQPSEALRDYALRRIDFQLSRFAGEVRSVVVRISDINGPRGGPDKRCQVSVRGPGFEPVTIDDLSLDAYSAVDMAVQRAARTVAREIGRGRHALRRSGAARAIGALRFARDR